MAKTPDLQNIRILLREGFTDEELRRLCFDIPDFRPVYDQLARNSGKDEIIDRLLEYVDRKLQIDTLLNLAKKHNPARYENHWPYYQDCGNNRRTSSAKYLIPIAFLVGTLIVIFLIAAFVLRPQSPICRADQFCIAVIGFTTQINETQITAEDIVSRLNRKIEEKELHNTIIVWGPDQVGTINDQPEQNTEQLAKQIAEITSAKLVIYGVIENPNGLTPRFYRPPNEADNSGPLARRISTSTRFNSEEIIGFVYHVLFNYKSALASFQHVERIKGACDKILCQFIAEAALSDNNLQLAEKYNSAALEYDHNYNEAKLGLAAVFCRSATEDFSSNSSLDKGIEIYEQVITTVKDSSLEKLAPIAYLGLGECYLIRGYYYSTNMQDTQEQYDLAIEEFKKVIADYGNGASPSLRTLATISHGRLGVVYYDLGCYSEAITEYNLALSNVDKIDPQREIYEKRVKELEGQLDASECPYK